LWPILLVSVWGCDAPADRLFKEQIQLTNEAADRIESGTYDALYAQGLQSRTLENLYKQEKLKIPRDERKRLEEKYRVEMEKALARVASAKQKQKMTGKRRSSAPDSLSQPGGPGSSTPTENEKVPAGTPKTDTGGQQQ